MYGVRIQAACCLLRSDNLHLGILPSDINARLLLLNLTPDHRGDGGQNVQVHQPLIVVGGPGRLGESQVQQASALSWLLDVGQWEAGRGWLQELVNFLKTCLKSISSHFKSF